jgi:DNA-binding CsgD family transcriptional regulator
VRTHATLLARVLDQVKLPVFVFESGRQIYVNDAATDLAGRLRAHDRIELRVLLIDHIAALEGASRGPAPPTVSLLTSQSGEPFYLHVWPMTRRGARGRLTFARRYRLSARESQVVELVVRGQANRQIALALGIGVETAKKHLSRIFDKVGVDSRAQLMAKLG